MAFFSVQSRHVFEKFLLWVTLTSGITCIAAQGHCTLGGGYWCSKSEKCVMASSKCNKFNDCLYGEDEANCSSHCSQRGGYWCSKSERCVMASLRCNSFNNCLYGEDEANCSSYCDITDKFWCIRSERCISASSRCDGYATCAYGEDEANCSSHCKDSGKFWCVKSGKCVNASHRCDGVEDCKFSDDETDCLSYCYESGDIWCSGSRKCIDASYKCDNVQHCINGEDEKYCFKKIEVRFGTDGILALLLPFGLGAVIISLFLIIYKCYCEPKYRNLSQHFPGSDHQMDFAFENGSFFTTLRAIPTAQSAQTALPIAPPFPLNHTLELTRMDAEELPAHVAPCDRVNDVDRQTEPVETSVTLDPPLYSDLVHNLASSRQEEEEPPAYDSVAHVESSNL